MDSALMSCVKYLIFLFNLIFAGTGIAILAAGGVLLKVYDNYPPVVIETFMFIPITIIVVGGIIFIISFCGCFGVIRESHCMISTFASLLIILFIMEIVGGIAGFMFYNDMKSSLENKFMISLRNVSFELNMQNNFLRDAWNAIQIEFQCCGVNGMEDWKEILPYSCCSLEVLVLQFCTYEIAYKTGCFPLLEIYVAQYASILIGIAVFLTFIQLLGVTYACCLSHSIRKG